MCEGIRTAICPDGNKNYLRSTVIYFFERELHIPVIVIIVHILPPIMHGKKVNEMEVTPQIFLMFHIVLEQDGNFKQLLKKASVYIH
ncbi:hypothetical protein [Sinomicrobium pectinilyticum]|uniref:hypothetical protein n=1 Tax=Sinomicrobium pectinilyticum TaxID=1084421 RepID=UPI001473A4C1|nr:hypothetical protein [Sinomicrobium pectinilyticum]